LPADENEKQDQKNGDELGTDAPAHDPVGVLSVELPAFAESANPEN
jgi:hypothetical protein